DSDYLYPWSDHNIALPSEGPGFLAGPLGGYYLDPSSGCVDAGFEGVEDTGLLHFTTRVDQQKDTGRVDVGMHYAALSPPITKTVAWVEDAWPDGSAGSTFGDGGDDWRWITAAPAAYSGSTAHQSLSLPGEHQHVFSQVTTPPLINAGDTLFC